LTTFAALLKTFRTLGQPYFLNMLLLSLVVTAAAFGVLFLMVGYLLSATAFVSTGWLEVILDWTAGLGAGVLAWFLFPALLPLVASGFAEQISGRIERREYGLDEPPSLAFWPEVLAGLKFAAISLACNLIALPLYLNPVLFPFLYYGINSYLLGREFFETVMGRHVGRQAANAFRRRHRLPVLLSGLVIALCATLPLAGLFAPFIGVALMVHLHQTMSARG
jgi:CysZ protein